MAVLRGAVRARPVSAFANILMAAGAIIWLIGELVGIWNHGSNPDTTTEWVRAFRRKVGRAFFAATFLTTALVLFIHFNG
jgi:hypothetical protein